MRGLWDRTPFLDPTGGSRPILGSVSIPLAELPDRLHELPEKNRTIYVVGEGEAVDQAIDFLIAGGRRAEAGTSWQYVDEPQRLRMWQPSDVLMVAIGQLEPGIAVDIACGAGREAVALAAYGWSVHAYDWQEEALMRGKDLARRYAPQASDRILWHLRDLEQQTFEAPEADLITAFRFLHRPLIPKLRDALRPGGSLLMETFTTIHRAKHGKPNSDSFVLAPGELLRFAGELDVVHYSEDWHEDAHTARIWLRRS